MKPDKFDDAMLMRFLLGALTPEETERVEARVFEETEFWEYLCALELEMIRDYARGELPANLTGAFEKRVAVSPEFAAKVRDHRSFMAALEKTAGHKMTKKAPRLWFSFRPAQWVPALCFLSVVAISVAGLGLGVRLVRRVDRLEEALQTSSKIQTGAVEPIAEFTVPQGNQRGDGAPLTLHLSAGASVMKLKPGGLPTPNGSPLVASLNVIGSAALEWSGLLQTDPADGKPAANIQAGLLRDGNYVLTVRPEGGTEGGARYFFSVLRE